MSQVSTNPSKTTMFKSLKRLVSPNNLQSISQSQTNAPLTVSTSFGEMNEPLPKIHLVTWKSDMWMRKEIEAELSTNYRLVFIDLEKIEEHTNYTLPKDVPAVVIVPALTRVMDKTVLMRILNESEGTLHFVVAHKFKLGRLIEKDLDKTILAKRNLHVHNVKFTTTDGKDVENVFCDIDAVTSILVKASMSVALEKVNSS